MTPEDLQALLDKHGLTEVGLARLLGVPQQTINRWVKGRKPRMEKLVDRALADLDRELTRKRRRPVRPTGDDEAGGKGE